MKQVVTSHIEKIRHSDEHTKRWWVIGATTIVMCAVIVLWVMYLTATLPKTSEQKTSTEVVQIETKKPSFLGTLIEGVKITSNNLWNSFRSIGTGFSKGVENAMQYTSKKKEIIIQKAPPETPFIPNNPEPLEPIQLPQSR